MLAFSGPGKNWQRLNVSANSASLIQCRSSTITRCAHASRLPMPQSPILANAINSAASVTVSRKFSLSAICDITDPYLPGRVDKALIYYRKPRSNQPTWNATACRNRCNHNNIGKHQFIIGYSLNPALGGYARGCSGYRLKRKEE